MAYADQVRGSRRVSIIAGVAAVHGAIGYLFVSGMAVEIATKFVPTLLTTNVPIDVPPPPPPEPAPPASKSIPAPRSATMPAPRIEAPASSWTVAVDPGLVTLPGVDAVTLAVEPTAEPTPSRPSLAAGPSVRGNRIAWFSTDDYPAAALRAGDEGTVAVTLAIAPDGRVADCAVTQPSGSATLDQTTCRLYRARGRFTPARDEAGNPIAATYRDRVRWQLPPQ
ncbi:energy transducer TonB [Sphingomonas corticis]|jgi:protein TonB|uniref:Energy transducer TonB n=1 Tax=Sphingomonas corticis TaxID=2722791 RepID=A0ABX1CT98_9SPHN|nr:energy transducer TonB [Sphingomonas corticis]NJR79052.1 energy transducer TonB [Sphingomonas corticis]